MKSRNKTLINGIIRTNALANGYLFVGPVGSFVSHAARYFIQAYRCEDFNDGPCGQCPSCRVDYDQNQVDNYVIRPEGRFSIDLIRDLKDVVKYGPSQESVLFVTLHKVSEMTTEAANSFLKSLEEPIKGVTYILLADSISSVLPTIRSRCQIMDFSCLNQTELNAFISERYANQTTDILTRSFHSPELLKALLERDVELEKNEYMTYDAVCRLKPYERIQMVPDFTKTKEKTTLLLLGWLSDLMAKWQHLKNKDLMNIDLIIEIILQMKYNLNLKLHMENLLIKL